MIYKFNQITLDTAQYRLCMAGSPISVEPQVFDLLAYLLENRSRVVTRGELLENLWKDKVVTDSALGACIKDARKAVGDSGDQQEVIKTIHGRGYQFVSPVTQIDAETEIVAPANSDLNKTDQVTTDTPSIAVLPFQNMSGDSEQEYFADGISEDIITGLSKFRELCVIARGSSFAFKGQSVDMTEVARKLGAKYVLEGSVRKGGQNVRITVQLSNAITGKHLWGETYDRVLEDIFAVQDDVAQKIISTLALRLEEENREQASRKSATNLSAYDYYLRGKYIWPDWKGSKDNVLSARKMFEKAMKLDPEYASAYIGLAESYLTEFASSWTTNREVAGERTYEYASKAVELDKFDCHAHVTLACAYFDVKSNFDLAELEIQRALDLNPNDYWVYCLKTDFSMCCGDFEDSIHSGNEAIRRNPLLPDTCLYVIGFSEYFAQRYENAIKTLRKLSEPQVEVDGCIAACYAQLGKDEDARAAISVFNARANTGLTNHQNWGNDNWHDYWANLFNFKNPEQLSHLIDGLRKAGLLK